MLKNLCSYWYLICKTIYSKMVKNKDMQFSWRIWKWKEKRTNNFDLKKRGFESDLNPRFSVIFPPMIWISWKVRSPRSNQNKLLNEIGLYLKIFRFPCLNILSLKTTYILVLRESMYLQIEQLQECMLHIRLDRSDKLPAIIYFLSYC